MNDSEAYPIEGADYWIQIMDLPPKIYAFVTKHSDGTYTIFMDSRRDPFQRLDDWTHEVMHIMNDDLYSDAPVNDIEGIP